LGTPPPRTRRWCRSRAPRGRGRVWEGLIPWRRQHNCRHRKPKNLDQIWCSNSVTKSDEDQPHQLVAGFRAEDDEVEEELEDFIPPRWRRPHLATTAGNRNPSTTWTYCTSLVGEASFPHPFDDEGNGALTARAQPPPPPLCLTYRLSLLWRRETVPESSWMYLFFCYGAHWV
jgi:hypothetical protein